MLLPLVVFVCFGKVDVLLKGSYFGFLSDVVEGYAYINLGLGIEFPLE